MKPSRASSAFRVLDATRTGVFLASFIVATAPLRAADSKAYGSVVQLPPMLVETSGPLHWRHVLHGRFDVK